MRGGVRVYMIVINDSSGSRCKVILIHYHFLHLLSILCLVNIARRKRLLLKSNILIIIGKVNAIPMETLFLLEVIIDFILIVNCFHYQIV